MAYSTSSPPSKISSRVGTGTARTMWWYVSADISTDVDAAGYFTNGSDLGMTVGDVVMVTDTATPSLAFMRVSAVTAGGAATVVAMPLV